MSDSEPELENAVPVSRHSFRVASRQGSDGSAVATGLRARDVFPAPELGLSQLQELIAEEDAVSSDQVQSPPASKVIGSPGRKCVRRPCCCSLACSRF